MAKKIIHSVIEGVDHYLDKSEVYTFKVNLENVDRPQTVFVTLQEGQSPKVEPKEGYYVEDLLVLVAEAHYHSKHS